MQACCARPEVAGERALQPCHGLRIPNIIFHTYNNIIRALCCSQGSCTYVIAIIMLIVRSFQLAAASGAVAIVTKQMVAC